jgi:hypothetical protein
MFRISGSLLWREFFNIKPIHPASNVYAGLGSVGKWNMD